MAQTIEIKEPSVCPFCGSPVVRMLEDGAHLYCSNPECKERKLQKLNYFVTKQCMNIDGLSEKTLRKLTTSGVVKDWSDLYKLSFDEFVAAGLGEKTSLKLVSEISKSRKEIPAENVLMALGIPMIGKVTAEKLINHFSSIKNIEAASLQELNKVEGLGEVAAMQVYKYMKSSTNELADVYKFLQYEGASKTVNVSSNKLAGMTILATGTLKNFTRDSIKESIILNGGKYASGVSSKLTFMIVGDAAGASKLNKAASLGIKIVNEEEYLKMIK